MQIHVKIDVFVEDFPGFEKLGKKIYRAHKKTKNQQLLSQRLQGIETNKKKWNRTKKIKRERKADGSISANTTESGNQIVKPGMNLNGSKHKGLSHTYSTRMSWPVGLRFGPRRESKRINEATKSLNQG